MNQSKTNLYKTENFRTILVQLIFPFISKKEELAASILLPHLLVHTSKKYPTEESFYKKIMENAILEMSCYRERIGKQQFYQVMLEIPDEFVLKEEILEKAISFLIDALYQPNVIEDAFNEDQFQLERKSLQSRVKNNVKNIYGYSYNAILDLVDTDGYLIENLEHNLEQLDSVTAKDVYTFYKKNIQNIEPYVFVFGNVETQKIEKILEKTVYKNQFPRKIIDKPFTCYLERAAKETIYKNDTGPYHQSYLAYAFKVEDMKEEDRPLLSLVYRLLTGDCSNLLHKKLRDEKDLVYSAKSTVFHQNGMLFIMALIHRKNKEKACEAIMETVEQLKNKELIETLLDKLKEENRIDIEKWKDNKHFLASEEIDIYFGFDQRAEELYKQRWQHTAEDVTRFLDRLKLDVVYYLEGEKDGQ